MQKMKTVGRTIIVAAALISLSIVQAEALAVRSAVLAPGTVTVTGGQAARLATILWEGVAVTTAAKGGSFSFSTAIVPGDCVGRSSDGVETVDVRVDGCAPPQTGLPGTGQTISYAPGDDGDLQVGGPLDYIDNADGTVTAPRTARTRSALALPNACAPPLAKSTPHAVEAGS